VKTIFIFTAAVILQWISTFSQTDSIIRLKETDVLIYDLHKVKYESTGETKIEKVPVNLEDVQTLTFLSNDSLILTKNQKISVRTKLSQIDEVSKYKRRFSPVLGVTLGAVGGLLLTGSIISLAGTSDAVSNTAALVYFSPGLGLVVAAVGGLIGATITNSINHSILDLSSVPDKDKKAKLINFLRNK